MNNLGREVGKLQINGFLGLCPRLSFFGGAERMFPLELLGQQPLQAAEYGGVPASQFQSNLRTDFRGFEQKCVGFRALLTANEMDPSIRFIVAKYCN